MGSTPKDSTSYISKMLKKKLLGTSLVVQWLRLCLPPQGVQVQYLVRELNSYMPHSQENQNIKQKQYCNRLIKTLEMVHIKKKKKPPKKKYQEVLKSKI